MFESYEAGKYSNEKRKKLSSVSFNFRILQTCLILLEENTTEQTNMQFKDKKDMSCSDGFLQLSPKHSYLQGLFNMMVCNSRTVKIASLLRKRRMGRMIFAVRTQFV